MLVLPIECGGMGAGLVGGRVPVGPTPRHLSSYSSLLCPLPAAPAVLEFLFLADPPLMFWHTAAALGQPYWLLPVPQGHWMQEEMQVRRLRARLLVG
jgi:hypothetical protein